MKTVFCVVWVFLYSFTTFASPWTSSASVSPDLRRQAHEIKKLFKKEGTSKNFFGALSSLATALGGDFLVYEDQAKSKPVSIENLELKRYRSLYWVERDPAASNLGYLVEVQDPFEAKRGDSQQLVLNLAVYLDQSGELLATRGFGFEVKGSREAMIQQENRWIQTLKTLEAEVNAELAHIHARHQTEKNSILAGLGNLLFPQAQAATGFASTVRCMLGVVTAMLGVMVAMVASIGIYNHIHAPEAWYFLAGAVMILISALVTIWAGAELVRKEEYGVKE